MLYYLSIFVIICYVVCDVNYFIRSIYLLFYGRLFERRYRLNETTRIYGKHLPICGRCTLLDCDVTLSRLRLARVIRQLDFARFHFYDRTGVYARSRAGYVSSLQGSTLVSEFGEVPLFAAYRIDTKLVFWDERSLFFEHSLVTTSDNLTRGLLVSRQYALSSRTKDTVGYLLQGLPGLWTPVCPEYLKFWLESMRISSEKIRKQIPMLQ